jgi:hypothetical protein
MMGSVFIEAKREIPTVKIGKFALLALEQERHTPEALQQ